MRSIRLAGLAVLVAGLAAGQADKAPAGKAKAAPAAAKADQSAFAGTETCEACHEDTVKAFQKNAHHALETDAHKGFAGHACESCHGPGEKHAESADATLIRNPAKLAPAAIDKLCLDCHLNQPTQVGRLESSHAKNQIACTSVVTRCTRTRWWRAPRSQINTQCSGCHASEWAQFQRPDHHKLPEGAMSCVDCHNPHGSIRPAMLQSFGPNEPGCLNCHGDKRGPFTFEHAPMRFDGCTACHEPHGSANPQMLVRQEVRLVCLECHASLPTPDQTRLQPDHRRGAAVVPRFAVAAISELHGVPSEGPRQLCGSGFAQMTRCADSIPDGLRGCGLGAGSACREPAAPVRLLPATMPAPARRLRRASTTASPAAASAPARLLRLPPRRRRRRRPHHHTRPAMTGSADGSRWVTAGTRASPGARTPTAAS